MGFYTEYLGMELDFGGLQRERKKQLLRISELRERRAILVIASDLLKPNSTIDYSDILPVQDQLANLKGQSITTWYWRPQAVLPKPPRTSLGRYKVADRRPDWQESGII